MVSQILKYSSTFLAVTLCAVFSTANAATVYSYIGNSFDTIVDSPSGQPDSYSSQMNISIEFSLDTAIGAGDFYNVTDQLTSFIMRDGLNTITKDSADNLSFLILTDLNSDIVGWQIVAEQYFSSPSYNIGDAMGIAMVTRDLSPLGDFNSADRGLIVTCLAVDLSGNCTNSGLEDIGTISNNPGTWTVTTVVPLPAAFPLFTIALLVITFLGLNRQVNGYRVATSV